MIYYNKKQLYDKVNEFRAKWQMRKAPYDPYEACRKEKRITIDEMPYKTKGVRGMLKIDETGHHILLNSVRTKTEQNFDLAHELMHSVLHASEDRTAFLCSLRITRNHYLEWQANEGAAEFLVPYREFLQDIRGIKESLRTEDDLYSFKFSEAIKFRVSVQTITYRLETLKYEIRQNLGGIAVEDVAVVSNKAQLATAMAALSLNEEYYGKKARKFKPLCVCDDGV